MKTKLEEFTKMTISVHPRVFDWLRSFDIVGYLEEDLVPIQRWITFTQIELFNYINSEWWLFDFEESNWGDIDSDMAKELAMSLYHLPILDDIDYIKLEMEN